MSNILAFLFLLLSSSGILTPEGVPFQSNISTGGRLQNSLLQTEPILASQRFSRALSAQFDSFKKEHPIQAKILAMVSDLLLRPSSSVHTLLKSSEGSGSGRRDVVSHPQAQDRIMGPLPMVTRGGRSDEEILLPQASSYQYYQQHPISHSYTSYPNVRRSGRFMFPDEYEEKVKKFEADQERSLGRSSSNGGNSFNNYHIINNQVRLGRVEAVQKPDVAAGVPFIPRGGGGRRKFEPSPSLRLVDASASSDVFSSLIDNKNTEQVHADSPNLRNEFENWKNFGVLPQEPKSQPQRYSEQFHSQSQPEMKSTGREYNGYDSTSNLNKPSSEWSATTDDTFTKLRNPYEGQPPAGNPDSVSLLQFRRPISVQRDSSIKIPVLRPMFRSGSGEFNSNSNRLTRQGKSLPGGLDLGSSLSSESEWQLLGTVGQSGERDKFIPSPAIGVGSVQVQPASAFSSSKEEAGAKELPRVSKVMRPSTIRSQPLIVKDARDGRSLKQIEVQGVKIIVGSKTPDFPKDIYMRNNYVRSLTPQTTTRVDKLGNSGGGSDSAVDVNVGSSITTL